MYHLENQYYDYLCLDIVHTILISRFVRLFLSVSFSHKLFTNQPPVSGANVKLGVYVQEAKYIIY